MNSQNRVDDGYYDVICSVFVHGQIIVTKKKSYISVFLRRHRTFIRMYVLHSPLAADDTNRLLYFFLKKKKPILVHLFPLCTLLT